MRRKRLLVIAVLVAAGLGAGGIWWWQRTHATAVVLANAQIALDQGDPAQAAHLVLPVVKRDPASYEACRILASALVRLGEYEQAQVAADRARRLRPDSAEPLVWKMRAYRSQAAMELGRDPNRAQMADVERSLKTLRKALAVATGVPPGSGRDADLDTEQGLTHLSVAECHRLLQTQTLQLSSLAANSGRPAEAERHAQDAEKQRAAVREAEDRAIEALERAVGCPRPSIEAGEELQSLYERRGLYEKVVAVYERLNGKGPVTERVALQAVGALLSANARESGTRVRETLTRAKQILQAHLGANPSSRDVQIAMGRLTLFEGNAAAAEQIVEGVLKKEPKNPYALVLKAECLLAQRRFNEAKQILQPISTYYPNWLEIQYSLAIAQLGTGYESMAQQTLRHILVLNPQYFAARLRLGESLCKLGQVDVAETELHEAVASSTSKDLVLPAVVNLIWQYATPERAAGMIDTALSSGESSPRLLEVAAAQYWRLGKILKAQECLARAGASEGRSPTANLMRAHRLAEMNQPASAEAILNKLLEDPVIAVDARIELARLRYTQGRGSDAHRLLSDALETPSITASQRLAVAQAYLEGGDLDGALESVRSVLAADERSYSGQMLLGQILQRRGDASGAQKAFAAADRLLPMENADPERRANLAMLAGDFKRCADICEKALRGNDPSPSLRLIAADALERMGRFEDAVAQLTAYIDSQPADLEGYTRLARAYLRAERPAEGIKALEALGDVRAGLAGFAESQILRATAGPAEAIVRLAPVLQDRAAGLTPAVRQEIATTLATWQATLGQTDDAVKTFDWLDAGAETPAAAWGRFGIYIEAGRIDAARQELQRIERLVSLESLTPPGFERLARAQLCVGETDAALATARQYAKIFGEMDGPVRLTMEIQRRSGKLPEAIKTFEEAARSRGGSAELLADGVALYAAAYDYPGADEVLGRLSKAGPTGLLRAGVLRAEILMRLGLYQAAAAGLAKLKEQTRDSLDLVEFARGKALAGAGKLEESDAALRTVPSYSPRYTEALRVMAGNARQRGEPRAALLLLDQALQHDPNDAEAAAEKVRLHLAADEIRPAVALAQGVIRRTNEPSQRVEWMGVLAELQWLSGDMTAAEKTYRAMGRHAAQAEVTRLRLALLLLTENRDADAAKILTETGTAGPLQGLVRSLVVLTGGESGPTASSAPAEVQGRPWISLLALALAARGEVEPARELLRTTPPFDLPRGDIERLAAGATDERARSRLRRLVIGRAMSGAGLHDVAVQGLKRLSEESPADVLAWQSLREALLAADRPAEAAQIAERMRGQNADSSIGKELAAEKAMAEGRYEEASRILTQIEAADGETPRLCVQRGDLLDRQGKPAEAARQYQRAFDLAPMYGSALNNEAYVLASSAKADKAALDRAFELMRKVASLGPMTPPALETLGWVEVLRGNTAEGLRSLAAAITELRNEPVAHYHIGMAYKDSGKLEWARLHLENVAFLAGGDLPERRLAAEALNDLRQRPSPASQATR